TLKIQPFCSLSLRVRAIDGTTVNMLLTTRRPVHAPLTPDLVGAALAAIMGSSSAHRGQARSHLFPGLRADPPAGETMRMTMNPASGRYARQIILPEIGEAGQARLAGARVLVVGAGALGTPALYYLAAAGIGVLGIADDDKLELSN